MRPDTVKVAVGLAVLVSVPQPRRVPWKTRTPCVSQMVLEEQPYVPQAGSSVSTVWALRNHRTVWTLCNSCQSALQWPAAAVAVQERLHSGPFLYWHC